MHGLCRGLHTVRRTGAPKGARRAGAAGGTPLAPPGRTFPPEAIAMGAVATSFTRSPVLGMVDELRRLGLYPYLGCAEEVASTRVRVDGRWLLNFSTYSYLGLLERSEVREAAKAAIDRYGTGTHGVRLLGGGVEVHAALEARLACVAEREAAIVFSSGYVANVATLGALLTRQDTVLCDAYDHASIVDGCRLSGATFRRFGHNDMEDLRRRLRAVPAGGRALVVVDAVYSMEGDVAPLPALHALCREYGARLMVDEAHSLGVLGANGRGIEEHFGLPGAIDVKMGTLSKAIPSNGGYVAADAETITLLKHAARGFVFSAALSPPAAAAAFAALGILEAEGAARCRRLARNAERFRAGLGELGYDTGASTTPIVPVLTGPEDAAYRLSRALRERGVLVLPVVFPAVPHGRARLRASVTAAHGAAEIDAALAAFGAAGRALGLAPAAGRAPASLACAGEVAGDAPRPRPGGPPASAAARRDLAAFSGTLNYTAVNEDWRMECRALQIRPDDRVFCVTGGSRSLVLLPADPARVVSLDMNPCQTHWLELQRAALRRMGCAEFRAFVGLDRGHGRIGQLRRLLPELPEPSRRYWQAHGACVRRGALYQGRWERHHQRIARLVRAARPEVVRRLLASRDLEQQRAVARALWDRPWWQRVVRVLCSPRLARCAFGDPAFYAHVSPDLCVGDYLYARFKGALERHWVRQSFMLSFLLEGRYGGGDLPPHLDEALYEQVRRRVDRIEARTGDVCEYLESVPPRSFTRFSLSDTPSYMPTEEVGRMLRAMVRAAAPGARFCIRQFLSDHRMPELAGACLRRERWLEQELEQDDRAFAYRFLVGTVRT